MSSGRGAGSTPALMDLIRALNTGGDAPTACFETLTRGLQAVYGRLGVAVLAGGARPERIIGLIREDRAAPLVAVDPMAREGGVPVPRGSFLEGLCRGRRPRVVEELDTGAEAALFGGYGAALALPVYLDVPQRYWLVLLGPRGWDPGSLPLNELAVLANLFAANVAKARETALLREANAWIAGQVQQISEVQQALLPRLEDTVEGVAVAASFQSMGAASGDYFDIVPLAADGDRGRWGAMIADAAGHGPAAAVESAMLDAILRTFPGPTSGPAAVLTYANRHLFTRRIRGTFITAFAAGYSPREGQLLYVCAGHPPALLRRAHGALERLEGSDGIPLGIDRDFVWRNVGVPMAPGDTLVLYTDGVVEAEAVDGSRFGLDRLEAVLAGAGPSPRAMVSAITRALKRFRGGTPRQDDETIVALQVSAA